MNESTPFDTIHDEPLEARIVAWVLGEASAFEAAELERLCEERPELLVFRRRMRALHGVLTEAEAAEPDDAWKLPAEKRKALDELFGEETPASPQQEKELRIRRSGRRALLAIAACVTLVFVVIRLLPREYESEAIIEIRPRELGVSPIAGASQMTPQFFATEFEKIKSRNTLSKVVDTLELENRWQVDKETAVQILKDSVKTENIKGTDLIALRVRNANKEDAQDIASEVARSYKEYREEIENRYANQKLAELNKAVRDQEDKVEERRKVLATIVRTKGIIFKGDDSFYASNSVNEDKGAQSSVGSQQQLQQDEGMKRQLDEGVVDLRARMQAELMTTADRLKAVEIAKNDTRENAIKTGLDAQDYADAKRDFESDQVLLQQLKLKQVAETITNKLPHDSIEVHDDPQVTTRLAIPFFSKRPDPGAIAANNKNNSAVRSVAESRPMQVAAAPPPPVSPSALADSKPALEGEEAPIDAMKDLASSKGSREFKYATEYEPEEKNKPAESDHDSPSGSPTASDAMSPADGTTVDGIPADPSQFASNGVTNGLRSGDQAINRNNIDAILNNPKRADSGNVSLGEPTSEPAQPEYALQLGSEVLNKSELASGPDGTTAKAGSQGKGVSRDLEGANQFQSPLAADPFIVEGPEAVVGNLTLETNHDSKSLGYYDSSNSAAKPAAASELKSAQDLFDPKWKSTGGKQTNLNEIELDRSSAQQSIAPSVEPIRTNPALTDRFAGKVDQVSRGLYLGEGKMNLGKYDEAKTEYEKVLREDPYNSAARLGLEKVEAAKTDYSRAANDQTRAELLMQVDNAWELIIPAEAGYAESLANKEIAALQERAGNLRKQLEDPALNDSKKQTQFKEWQETQEKLDDLAKVKAKEPVLDEKALEEKSARLRRTLEEQTGDYKKQSVFREWQETQVKLQEIAKAKPAPAKKSPLESIEEIAASEEAYSTFSLNINDASFQIAKAALKKGERPDPEAIKVEQFYNAVDYGDPAPATNEPVAARIEQSVHPIIPGRNLVRVSLKTAAAGRSASQPLRLTLLVDQSGSMVREDRRTAMSNALKQLGGLLTPNDHITVVGFSRESHLLADNWTGDLAGKLGDLVNQTASEGGTNLEQAINLAEQMAARPHPAGEQNRIVLFTDGAANLGNANPERLAERVKSLRQKGIAFDIAGIGADGVNDRLLSELARNGNGRYYVVGDEKNESFARQLAGAFRPAAENVKVQVHFNPDRVGRYKLIGFEKDRLKTEDFRNDAVDAAELAAEEAGVAIYQVEALPQGSGEIGEVSVRFRDTSKGEMVERKWTMPFESTTQAFARATPSMQLAGLSMLAAEKLKGGPLADAIDFKQLSGSQSNVRQFYNSSPRVADMLRVIDLLK